MSRAGSGYWAQTKGVNKIENRDAVGFYFTIRAGPNEDLSRVAVLFSGMSFYASPEHFGLPDFGDRDTNFLQFAIAAIGDHLDENGPLPLTPSGVAAAKIECFTPRFQIWKDREISSDEAIQSYMESRLYWSWRYNHTATLFTSHDLLRLGAQMRDLHRIGQLEEGNGWITKSKSDYGISFEPTPNLLRSVKSRIEMMSGAQFTPEIR